MDPDERAAKLGIGEGDTERTVANTIKIIRP